VVFNSGEVRRAYYSIFYREIFFFIRVEIRANERRGTLICKNRKHVIGLLAVYLLSGDRGSLFNAATV